MREMEDLTLRVGEELGVSPWLVVDQSRIAAFADCTEDRQWIHLDQERANRETPFGGTISHGFLSLALLTHLQRGLDFLPRDAMALNYGLERVRFLNPVKTGARLRARVRLEAIEPRAGGRLLSLYNTLEIEGEEKPAMVAIMMILVLPTAQPVERSTGKQRVKA